MLQSYLHLRRVLPVSRDSVCSFSPFDDKWLTVRSNRTLEDLDAYFDIDSGHKTIIPIGDKVAKSSTRPLEAIEAEQARIEVAAGGKDIDAAKSHTTHIEEVAP